jgi:NAD(P)-dependent dehydrogenase (short-subunit alcohol dehydrogenase family)
MTTRHEPPSEEQRTLILTGASRGIGHATVKRFSSAGWRVITCSRHAFPENCPWAAGPEDHIQVDLSDPQDTLRAVAEMRERLKDGKLHALVNNAGISPKSPPSRGEVDKIAARDFSGGGQVVHDTRLGTLTTDMATWRHVFEVNVFSTIWLAQGLKDELARAHGAIVNVTSIAGSRVHPFAGAAYATSKAALAALTREMAADFGPLGVRVNAIAPGEIDTAILSPGTDKLVETLPMRRLGLPEEVAKAIYYLCTDQSSYVTGAELHINGGQHV